MILMMMEMMTVLFLSIVASSVYMTVTMYFFDTKINYPRACVFRDEGGDFVIENLAELEMFCTIWSPTIFAMPIIMSFTEKDLLLIKAIAALVTIQAVIPFFQCVERCRCSCAVKNVKTCANVSETLTLVILPILVIMTCAVNFTMDSDYRFVSYNAYTVTVQVCLMLIYMGRRYCCRPCRCCCEKVRAYKQKGIGVQ